MRGIKTKLLKALPNNEEVRFKSNRFEIDDIEYILWTITREGKTIWLEIEDSSSFAISLGGIYYTNYVDVNPKLYPYIMKYLEGVVF